MKKKLKYFIPMGIVLAVSLAIALTLTLQKLPRGEVVLTALAQESDNSYTLLRVYESGSRRTALDPGGEVTFTAQTMATSPNGRFVAFCIMDLDGSALLVYDTQTPNTPKLILRGFVSDPQLTDEGLLLYRRVEGLICHNGAGERLLDAGAIYYNMVLLDQTVYYFRKNGTNTDLYACDLPDGQPRPVASDVTAGSLQVSAFQGKHYILIERHRLLEGTAYDRLIDDAGAEQDELRAELKAIEFSETVIDVYRIVDGVETLLAGGVVGQYCAEPVSGTVVHKASTLAQPVMQLSQVHTTKIPEVTHWFLSRQGQTRMLTKAESVAPVITPKGQVYLLSDKRVLYRWNGEEAVLLHKKVERLCVTVDEEGAETLYFCTADHQLLADAGDGLQKLRDGLFNLHFPAELLPGGALLLTAEEYLFTLLESESLREPGPVMLLQGGGYNYGYTAPDAVLYLHRDGADTPLLSGSSMLPTAIAENGDVLVRGQGGWWAAGTDRSQLLVTADQMPSLTGISGQALQRMVRPEKLR